MRKSNQTLDRLGPGLRRAHRAAGQPELDRCWCNQLMARVGAVARQEEGARDNQAWFSPTGLTRVAWSAGLAGAMGLLYLVSGGFGLDSGTALYALADPAGVLPLISQVF